MRRFSRRRLVATALLPAAAVLTVLAPQPASAVTAITFPLDTTSAVVLDNVPNWCYGSMTSCHHHYKAADIPVPTGTRVVSPVNGTVVHVTVKGYDSGSSVTIKAADDFLWHLTHMDDAPGPVVQVGASVSRGTLLGYVGTKYHAQDTYPHLHIDKLPQSYDYRPDCKGAECTGLPFIEIQPVLIEAFQELDGSTSVGTGVNSGAAVMADGVAHVTAIKTSTGVLYKSPPSTWQNLQGTVEGTPSITYHDGRYDIFATSPGGTMYMKTWTSPTTGWTSWSSLGGTGLSDAAAVWAQNEYHVFSINASGRLMQRTWDGAWGAWQDLGGDGGIVQGTPAVTYHDGRYDVFAHSPGGTMYQKYWTLGTGWSSWSSLGGSGFTGGTGAVYANGEFHVFGINAAGDLMHRKRTSTWAPWENLGGTITGTPSAVYDNGSLHVYGRSPGGIMYRKTWNGTWATGWTSLGGNFS